MLNVNIKAGLDTLFTEERITRLSNLGPKYIKHFYYVGKQVVWDYWKILKVISILFLLMYAANRCGEQFIQIDNPKVLKDFILQNQAAILIVGNILVSISKLTYGLLIIVTCIIGFYMGLRFVNCLYTRPFIAMTDQEHIALISILKYIGMIGKHKDGCLVYDWDEVLNVLYEEYLENDNSINELYQKIQSHFYYLKSTSIRVFDLDKFVVLTQKQLCKKTGNSEFHLLRAD